MFLLAIMGTYVEPSLNKDEYSLLRLFDGQYGQFNEHGDLFLEPYEIVKIQKQFNNLYVNRMQHESRLREFRKQERA